MGDQGSPQVDRQGSWFTYNPGRDLLSESLGAAVASGRPGTGNKTDRCRTTPTLADGTRWAAVRWTRFPLCTLGPNSKGTTQGRPRRRCFAAGHWRLWPWPKGEDHILIWRDGRRPRWP